MHYLADTVAIIRHFAKIGAIGKTAKQLLRDADRGKVTIFLSIISLVEILYLSERHKIPLDIDVVKTQLHALDNYRIVDLDLEIVETAKRVTGLELHDRLIVASALSVHVPILTSDEMIRESGIVQTIWS